MYVLEIDSQEHNYFIVGDEPFFLLETCNEKKMICPDRCPHRGGPLHLGKMNCQTKSLTCPWHHMTIMPGALNRRSIPAVSNGPTIFAVFPVEPDTPVRRQHRRILANEH